VFWIHVFYTLFSLPAPFCLFPSLSPLYHSSPSFFFFPFLVLGFELRPLHLHDRHSITWATPAALFALIILESGFYFLPRPVWTVILLFCASCHSWNGSTCHHTQIFPLRQGHANFFCLGWPQLPILLISRLQCNWNNKHEPPAPSFFSFLKSPRARHHLSGGEYCHWPCWCCPVPYQFLPLPCT
jgi:hypothetical protein